MRHISSKMWHCVHPLKSKTNNLLLLVITLALELSICHRQHKNCAQKQITIHLMDWTYGHVPRFSSQFLAKYFDHYDFKFIIEFCKVSLEDVPCLLSINIQLMLLQIVFKNENKSPKYHLNWKLSSTWSSIIPY